MTCQYSGCQEPILLGAENWCIFHAPLTAKRYNLNRFSELIFSKMSNDCSFAGYVFPAAFDFSHKQFSKRANFQNASFGAAEGDSGSDAVSFEACIFQEGVDFAHVRVRADSCSFQNARFFGRASYFNHSEFDLEDTLEFRGASFDGGVSFNGMKVRARSTRLVNLRVLGPFFSLNAIEVHCTLLSLSGSIIQADEFDLGEDSILDVERILLGDVEFASKLTEFGNSDFGTTEVKFHNCTFSGYTRFYGVRFKASDTHFSNCQIDGVLEFVECWHSGSLSFYDLQFSASSRFRYRVPFFLPDKLVRVIFHGTNFPAFATVFEGIDWSRFHVDRAIGAKSPAILFRYCCLKDVYFSDSEMALFSFFKSSFFEEAIYVSCKWMSRIERSSVIDRTGFVRRNLLFEQILMEQTEHKGKMAADRDEIRKFYLCEELRDYWELANLYRRMKTAFDRTKDYENAGRFYYNEIDMKVKALKAEIRDDWSGTKGWRKFRVLGGISNWILHWGYQRMAGFGEKPLFALGWFFASLLGFAGLNLLNGIRVGNRVVNYSIQITNLDAWCNFACWSFWKDYLTSVVFSIYRVLPISYLPFEKGQFALAEFGLWDIFVSLLNSLVLAILLVFFGMGLKRNFKRY